MTSTQPGLFFSSASLKGLMSNPKKKKNSRKTAQSEAYQTDIDMLVKSILKQETGKDNLPKNQFKKKTTKSALKKRVIVPRVIKLDEQKPFQNFSWNNIFNYASAVGLDRIHVEFLEHNFGQYKRTKLVAEHSLQQGYEMLSSERNGTVSEEEASTALALADIDVDQYTLSSALEKAQRRSDGARTGDPATASGHRGENISFSALTHCLVHDIGIHQMATVLAERHGILSNQGIFQGNSRFGNQAVSAPFLAGSLFDTSSIALEHSKVDGSLYNSQSSADMNSGPLFNGNGEDKQVLRSQSQGNPSGQIIASSQEMMLTLPPLPRGGAGSFDSTSMYSMASKRRRKNEGGKSSLNDKKLQTMGGFDQSFGRETPRCLKQGSTGAPKVERAGSMNAIEELRRELKLAQEGLSRLDSIVEDNIAWVQSNCDVGSTTIDLSSRAKNKCKKIAVEKFSLVLSNSVFMRLERAFAKWRQYFYFMDMTVIVRSYSRIKAVQMLANVVGRWIFRMYLNVFKKWTRAVNIMRRFEQEAAALEIQRVVRGRLGKNKSKRRGTELLNIKKHNAAVVIQKRARGIQGRRRFLRIWKEKKRDWAIWYLQHWFKTRYVINQAKHEANTRRGKRAAATKIQKIVRGRQGRTRFNRIKAKVEEEKKKRESASALSRFLRRNKETKSERNLLKMKKKEKEEQQKQSIFSQGLSAMSNAIQNIGGKFEKNEKTDLPDNDNDIDKHNFGKDIDQAAIKLQSISRGHLIRRQKVPAEKKPIAVEAPPTENPISDVDKVEADKAALKLQAVSRGRLARKKSEVIKAEKKKSGMSFFSRKRGEDSSPEPADEKSFSSKLFSGKLFGHGSDVKTDAVEVSPEVQRLDVSIPATEPSKEKMMSSKDENVTVSISTIPTSTGSGSANSTSNVKSPEIVKPAKKAVEPVSSVSVTPKKVLDPNPPKTPDVMVESDKKIAKTPVENDKASGPKPVEILRPPSTKNSYAEPSKPAEVKHEIPAKKTPQNRAPSPKSKESAPSAEPQVSSQKPSSKPVNEKPPTPDKPPSRGRRGSTPEIQPTKVSEVQPRNAHPSLPNSKSTLEVEDASDKVAKPTLKVTNRPTSKGKTGTSKESETNKQTPEKLNAKAAAGTGSRTSAISPKTEVVVKPQAPKSSEKSVLRDDVDSSKRAAATPPKSTRPSSGSKPPSPASSSKEALTPTPTNKPTTPAPAQRNTGILKEPPAVHEVDDSVVSQKKESVKIDATTMAKSGRPPSGKKADAPQPAVDSTGVIPVKLPVKSEVKISVAAPDAPKSGSTVPSQKVDPKNTKHVPQSPPEGTSPVRAISPVQEAKNEVAPTSEPKKSVVLESPAKKSAIKSDSVDVEAVKKKSIEAKSVDPVPQQLVAAPTPSPKHTSEVPTTQDARLFAAVSEDKSEVQKANELPSAQNTVSVPGEEAKLLSAQTRSEPATTKVDDSSLKDKSQRESERVPMQRAQSPSSKFLQNAKETLSGLGSSFKRAISPLSKSRPSSKQGKASQDSYDSDDLSASSRGGGSKSRSALSQAERQALEETRRMIEAQRKAAEYLTWAVITIQRIARHYLAKREYRRLLVEKKKRPGKWKKPKPDSKYFAAPKDLSRPASGPRPKKDRRNQKVAAPKNVEEDDGEDTQVKKPPTPAINTDEIANEIKKKVAQDVSEMDLRIKRLEELEKAILDRELRVSEISKNAELQAEQAKEALQLLQRQQQEAEAEQRKMHQLLEMAAGPLSHRSDVIATGRKSPGSARSRRGSKSGQMSARDRGLPPTALSARGGAGIPTDATVIQYEGDNWVQLWDPDEYSWYWYNRRTQEAQWEYPGTMADNYSGYESAGGLTDYSTDAGEESGYESEYDYGRGGNHTTAWQEYWDEQAQAKYWYNGITGEASWTKPDELASKPNSARGGTSRFGADDWVSYVDDATDQEYWYNAVTGETSWTHP